jgi:hypothetical protein
VRESVARRLPGRRRFDVSDAFDVAGSLKGTQGWIMRALTEGQTTIRDVMLWLNVK